MEVIKYKLLKRITIVYNRLKEFLQHGWNEVERFNVDGITYIVIER